MAPRDDGAAASLKHCMIVFVVVRAFVGVSLSAISGGKSSRQQHWAPAREAAAAGYTFGADATIYPGPANGGLGGDFDLNRTVAALVAERVQIFGFEKAFRCARWRQLDALLAATQPHGIRILAGLESHGRSDLRDYCVNFRNGKVAGAPINWSSTFEQFASKSKAYPNLMGIRMDDWVHACAVPAYEQRDVPRPWSPADVKRYANAAKAVNPRFAFLPLFYYWQLGQFSPYSYSFGGHVSPPLLKGASARMRMTFNVDAVSDAANLSFFEFADTYATSQGELLPRGLVRRTITLNDAVLLDDDLADRPDAYFGILDGKLSVGDKLRDGQNLLEFRVAGAASSRTWAATGFNASRTCSHCSNSVNIWDVSLVMGNGFELLGNRTNVSFVLEDVPEAIGATFGGSNSNYSALQYADGVLGCTTQWESHGNWTAASNPELQLYVRLLESMRRALVGGRSTGDRKLLYATHFGQSNWAPNSPFKQHHMQRERQLPLLLADLTHADGSMMFWDVLGLTSDLQHRRGIFSRPVSQLAEFPLLLRYWFKSPVMHGYFQRITSRRSFVGSVTIRMHQAASTMWSEHGGFNKSISIGGVLMYRQPSGLTPCWNTTSAPSPCPGGVQQTGINCSVHCQGSVEIVKVHLSVARSIQLSMDAAFGGMQNFSWYCGVTSGEDVGTSQPSDWNFDSGVANFVKDIHMTYVNISKSRRDGAVPGG